MENELRKKMSFIAVLNQMYSYFKASGKNSNTVNEV